jgi:tetratricopeptide (TPR) repeat protein
MPAGRDSIPARTQKPRSNSSGTRFATVREYQRSADAQFGLGRAYRAAGENQFAVAAFKRALQIRPRFPRALQALQQR